MMYFRGSSSGIALHTTIRLLFGICAVPALLSRQTLTRLRLISSLSLRLARRSTHIVDVLAVGPVRLPAPAHTVPFASSIL